MLLVHGFPEVKIKCILLKIKRLSSFEKVGYPPFSRAPLYEQPYDPYYLIYGNIGHISCSYSTA